MTTLLDADHTAHRPFRARRVAFDYATTPSHWIPGDAHTTHVVNVLHLLLPAGERWFCDVYRQALPHVTDEVLRRDIKAFIGQEATHARAHTIAIDHLSACGIDASPFTRMVEAGFALARTRPAPRWLPGRLGRLTERQILLQNLALIAAIEHFTSALGWWILVTRGLDQAGADPEMLALLRWHGAEEVEHRSVAFDTYRAVGGGYLRRAVSMILVFWIMLGLWITGAGFLMRADRSTGHRHLSAREFVRAGRQDRLPRFLPILASVPRYLAPRYHPSHEGRTEVAADYLAAARGVMSRV